LTPFVRTNLKEDNSQKIMKNLFEKIEWRGRQEDLVSLKII